MTCTGLQTSRAITLGAPSSTTPASRVRHNILHLAFTVCQKILIRSLGGTPLTMAVCTGLLRLQILVLQPARWYSNCPHLPLVNSVFEWCVGSLVNGWGLGQLFRFRYFHHSASGRAPPGSLLSHVCILYSHINLGSRTHLPRILLLQVWFLFPSHIAL